MAYNDKEHLLRMQDYEDEVQDEPEQSRSSACQSTLYIVVAGCAVVLILLLSCFLEVHFSDPFVTPELPPQEVCDFAMARQSWHDLPRHRRRAYTRAVQRLASLPSRLGLNTSLYDDFTYVHIHQVWDTHHAAISLPYHRYFLAVFEQALKKEGGYDGPMPYWDWTQDAEDPLNSVIWDDWAGFGGNGSGSDNCVRDGLFHRVGKAVNYTSDGYGPHCVSRSFNSSAEFGIMHSKAWSKDVVNEILEGAKTYDDFRTRLEEGPHRYVHRGIGGEMPTASSTNDNLFFLHHAQVDRLWWLWQKQDPEQRNTAYAGSSFSEDGIEVKNSAALSDKILMHGLAPDVLVKDVMQTNTELLCYKYKIES